MRNICDAPLYLSFEINRKFDNIFQTGRLAMAFSKIYLFNISDRMMIKLIIYRYANRIQWQKSFSRTCRVSYGIQCAVGVGWGEVGDTFTPVIQGRL